MQNGLGLTEILSGQSEPIEVIRPVATKHLFLLSAGSLPPNPGELVGSKKMQEIVCGSRVWSLSTKQDAMGSAMGLKILEVTA